MSRIGFGYGSEWHLLRWMGRHRNRLDSLVKEAISQPTTTIRWEDFSVLYRPSQRLDSPYVEHDAEHQGISMFEPKHPIHDRWRNFWPSSGNAQCWDAVAWMKSLNGREPELLLVEAKAHKGEVISDCGAKDKDSQNKIINALDTAKAFCDANGGGDWTKRYYQYANRITFLHFLHDNNIPAHLLFIYFYGDHRPGNAACPQRKDDWDVVLGDQDAYLGLTDNHPLSSRIHKLFLPVSPIEAHVSNEKTPMMVT